MLFIFLELNDYMITIMISIKNCIFWSPSSSRRSFHKNDFSQRNLIISKLSLHANRVSKQIQTHTTDNYLFERASAYVCQQALKDALAEMLRTINEFFHRVMVTGTAWNHRMFITGTKTECYTSRSVHWSRIRCTIITKLLIVSPALKLKIYSNAL